MLTKKVREIMINASEYGIVSVDASVPEAIKFLYEPQDSTPEYLHPSRAVPAVNSHSKNIGKAGQRVYLKALQPHGDTVRKLDDANAGSGQIDKINDFIIGSARLSYLMPDNGNNKNL